MDVNRAAALPGLMSITNERGIYYFACTVNLRGGL